MNMNDANCAPKRVSMVSSDGSKKLRYDFVQPNVNSNYIQKASQLSEYYASNGADNELGSVAKDVELILTPFKVMKLSNFIVDEQYLQHLRREISQLDFTAKSNDLYRLRQSIDLNNVTDGSIGQLCHLFRHNVLPLMSQLTNISLNDNIAINVSKYDQNDYLLCHDDELEGRRIAFILYLVQQWNKSDGGLLDMFECDQNGEPSRVVNSLIPEWNTFIFFEVTPESFHQVSEILSDSKIRLSINGWFHGEPIVRPKPFIELQYQVSEARDLPEEILRSWINPLYLQDETQLQIQESFGESSEIALQDFLCDDKYIELARALKDSEAIDWQWTRPPNKRKYETASMSSVPTIVSEAFELFRSEALFLILSNLTGLKLHELAMVDNSSDDEEEGVNSNITEPIPRCRGEIRRWSSSCYTLVHDNAAETREGSALDVIIHFNCDHEFNRDNGGFISYIAKNEDEELLTIDPLSNCLNIVYRDSQTARFTKYINSKCEDAIHDFSFVYYR